MSELEKKRFQDVACLPGNPGWEELTERSSRLYARKDDVRSPFARDYTRILHSQAYRRLKHKTQVFYNIDNDHICTRMEHVAHVESVSGTIASYLGLNPELTKAIAIGHDLGHSPFGHQGETIISKIRKDHVGETFWHEKNGLRFVDKIELLADNYNEYRNLDLTYAVRDGIISHCGEVDENGLKPRKERIDLEQDFLKPGQMEPATWEGCVVKISDKIAYIGRDIEDARSLGFLSDKAQKLLLEMARVSDERVLNTTVIMHNLIIDIAETSRPETGICLSPAFNEQMKELKQFNYRYIYEHPRFKPYRSYAELVINEIFEALFEVYHGDGADLWTCLDEGANYCPHLYASFKEYLCRYIEADRLPDDIKDRNETGLRGFRNQKIYGMLNTEQIYAQACIDFISGMTDRYAIKVFDELLRY